MWFLKLTIVFTTGLSSVHIAAAVLATFVSGSSPLLLCVVGYNCVYGGYHKLKLGRPCIGTILLFLNRAFVLTNKEEGSFLGSIENKCA